jgi:AcrR family transcriptional regulator
MPRPRTASDVEILEGTIRAISRVGPARLTLTEVGREVGLSPATLLQRFGSKRGLLLALAEHAATSIDECVDAARRAADSPLGALLVAATDMAKHVESPEALANHLAFLQIDLSDPAFHTLALSAAERTLDGYEVLLREAILVGELAPCDVGRLARAIQAMTGGSLINWAIHRNGRLIEWLRSDLQALLGPYRRDRAAPPAHTDRPAPRARHRPSASGAAAKPAAGQRAVPMPAPPPTTTHGRTAGEPPGPRRRGTP